MAFIKEARLIMKADPEIRKMMVRGNRNEILLDIDGDGQPDIAIQDMNNDGLVDRVAFDLSGSGVYDLFIDDSDNNGIPDRIFTFTEGGDEALDKEEVIAEGEGLEAAVVQGYEDLLTLLEMKEIVKDQLDKDLAALQRDIRTVRRELR